MFAGHWGLAQPFRLNSQFMVAPPFRPFLAKGGILTTSDIIPQSHPLAKSARRVGQPQFRSRAEGLASPSSSTDTDARSRAILPVPQIGPFILCPL
jgi:hypothetical protein